MTTHRAPRAVGAKRRRWGPFTPLPRKPCWRSWALAALAPPARPTDARGAAAAAAAGGAAEQEELPIFPLGLVGVPGGNTDLHIFEVRRRPCAGLPLKEGGALGDGMTT